jgi:hypothetical protein
MLGEETAAASNDASNDALNDDAFHNDAFSNKAFDVTLVAPYGPRVIRAHAAEHIWDEAKGAGNLPSGPLPHLRRTTAPAGGI